MSTNSEKREAFSKIAVPVLDSLYRQALKYTGNPDDAEDLVQDAFERGYKAFDSFTPGTNISAWLSTILRNTYFNLYAKNKRRPQRANEETGEFNDWDLYEAADHTGEGMKSAEETYIDQLQPQEIITALKNLPPERRRVFVAAAIEGKSYKDIAADEGIKIGTVMSRLNRARTQLKKELAGYITSSGGQDGHSAHSTGRNSKNAHSVNKRDK